MIDLIPSSQATAVVSSRQAQRGARQQSWSLALCLLLGLGTVSLTGCNALARFGIGTTSIEAVVNNPMGHSDVIVRGEVTNQFGAFGRGVYEIQDKTGTLWVLTEAGLPSMHSTVTVRGTAAEGVSLGGRNFGVLFTESERL